VQKKEKKETVPSREGGKNPVLTFRSKRKDFLPCRRKGPPLFEDHPRGERKRAFLWSGERHFPSIHGGKEGWALATRIKGPASSLNKKKGKEKGYSTTGGEKKQATPA